MIAAVPAARAMRNGRSVVLFGLAAFCVAPLIVAGTAGDDVSAEFLAAIGGAWTGRAVHTPAGPFPYDIDFTLDSDGCRSGTAEPGGFHHHWKFCAADTGLELEFLSDFGGNERPLILRAGRGGDGAGALLFRSATIDFLKVRARREADCVQLQVLHHDRLHVEIHLRRATVPEGQCPWPEPAPGST